MEKKSTKLGILTFSVALLGFVSLGFVNSYKQVSKDIFSLSPSPHMAAIKPKVFEKKEVLAPTMMKEEVVTPTPVPAPKPVPAAGGTSTDTSLIIKGIISIITLVPALYILISGKYADKTTSWASATVGLVLGFWLKS